MKVAEAHGELFDFGRFDIVLEDASGRRIPGERARDDKKRPRGRKLELCTGCREFIFASEFLQDAKNMRMMQANGEIDGDGKISHL